MGDGIKDWHEEMEVKLYNDRVDTLEKLGYGKIVDAIVAISGDIAALNIDSMRLTRSEYHKLNDIRKISLQLLGKM